MQCFTCSTCRNRLVPGDRFRYVNGSIFCEHDHPGGELLGGHAGRMSEQKVRRSRSSRVEVQEGGGAGPTAGVSAGLLKSFCCLWTIRRFLLLRTRELVPAGLSRPHQTSTPTCGAVLTDVGRGQFLRVRPTSGSSLVFLCEIQPFCFFVPVSPQTHTSNICSDLHTISCLLSSQLAAASWLARTAILVRLGQSCHGNSW